MISYPIASIKQALGSIPKISSAFDKEAVRLKIESTFHIPMHYLINCGYVIELPNKYELTQSGLVFTSQP